MAVDDSPGEEQQGSSSPKKIVKCEIIASRVRICCGNKIESNYAEKESEDMKIESKNNKPEGLKKK